MELPCKNAFQQNAEPQKSGEKKYTLAAVPAARAQLDTMTDTTLPLTAALLPYDVKKALTTAASAGEWSTEDKDAALRTLGADFSSYYTKEDIDALLSAPASGAYPVGSIYQSTDPTSPAALFGGTWEQIASERVLMGASDAHAAGSTAEAGLPNIAGRYNRQTGYGEMSTDNQSTGPFYRDGPDTGRAPAGSQYVSAGLVYFDASRCSAIYGASDTVQPAAYYVYIWHRVA